MCEYPAFPVIRDQDVDSHWLAVARAASEGERPPLSIRNATATTPHSGRGGRGGRGSRSAAATPRALHVSN